ncbi:hypothetical protein [Kiloniella sp.]|uniref:hypothetical protein n=1 Tax=Kiloniella sp. TaxID=1938587 RepID=UPI003B02C278
MQGTHFNKEKYGSITLSVTLLTLLIITIYLQSIMTVELWPYGLIGRSLCVGLGVILFLRLIPRLIAPNLKVSLLIIFWAGFITLIIHLAFMDPPQIVQFLTDLQDGLGPESLLVCALLYLLLLSVPFVPGIEIGLLIMAAFGKDGVISVYFATIGGLSLAYFFGTSFPQLWEKAGFINFDSSAFSRTDEAPFSNDKASIPLALKLIRSISPWIIRYRYLTLAILINLPGNVVFGGGGGISFISGASRKFKWFWFMSTLVLATLPVPLLVYFGFMELEKLIE